MPDCFCGGTDPPSLAQPEGIFLRVATTPRIDIGWKFADAPATAFFSPVLQFAVLFFWTCPCVAGRARGSASSLRLRTELFSPSAASLDPTRRR